MIEERKIYIVTVGDFEETYDTLDEAKEREERLRLYHRLKDVCTPATYANVHQFIVDNVDSVWAALNSYYNGENENGEKETTK